MQSDQQKRILGYFIEEAQEHLTTIEESLMNLQQVVNDPEAMSEMFRAAHSVKGGAAMLGLHSIQHTAHKLEDYFKVLREHPITVDSTLENLFLQGVDALRELLDELQGPFGLTEETATATLSRVEPVFKQLHDHLNALTQGGATPAEPVATGVVETPPPPPVDPSYTFVFQTDVPERLRAMLQLFKQPDSPAVRQQLVEACSNLGQLGETFALPKWVDLLAIAQQVVSNDSQPLTVLAPVVIKEIMAARDRVLSGQGCVIAASQALLDLQPAPVPAAELEPIQDLSAPLEQAAVEEVAPVAEAIAVEEADLITDVPDGVTVFGDDSQTDLEELSDIFSLAGDLGEQWGDDTLDEQLAGLKSDEFIDEDISDFLTVTSDSAEASTEDLSIDQLLTDIDNFLDDKPADTITDDIDALLLDETASAIADSPSEEHEEVDIASFLEGFSDTAVSYPADAAIADALAADEGVRTEAPLADLELPESEPLSADTFSDVAAFLGDVPGLTDALDNLVVENTAADVLAEFVASPPLEDLWLEAETPAAPEIPTDTTAPVNPPEALIPDTPDTSEQPEADTSHSLDALEDLENLINESLQTTPHEASAVADPEQLLVDESAATAAAPVFEDLEQMLGAPSAPEVAPSSASPATDSDFKELEGIIGTPTKPTAPRRREAAKGGSLVEQTMRVPVRHLDSLSNLVGELVVNRNSLEDSQERLRQFLDNLLYQVQQLGDVSQQMQDLYERSLLESSLLGITTARVTNGHGQKDRAHATGVEFDALEMDRFTGFHTLSQEVIERIVRVREAADDIQYVVDEVEQVARQFRQVTTQVQEGLSRSRMVPFREMSSRLPAAVRRVASTIGKQVELKVEGEDTLIDKGILEKLFDPMTHLINNAIYHGIELPEVRKQLGKPEKGLIRVRAFYQGSQAIISVSDDGSGIDPARVKQKAIEKGLLNPADAPNLSRQEVYAFLFRSGFSTQDQADSLAGRGVGMDVVRKNLEDIRGTINTDSTVGKGTTFTIRLPLTLSITKALCCIDNHCRIAFPIDGVEDMLDIPQERIHTLEEGKQVLPWHDRQLPLRNLSDLLTYSRNISRSNVYGGSNQDDGMVSVVVLRSGDDLVAIKVDQVIGEQEIVIKQLSGPVPKPVGIAGVTVQGDGRAMAIADILEIIDLSLERMDREWRSSFGHDRTIGVLEPTEVAAEPLVLIIDDSITVRELLSMTFTRAGYRVEQARDGQDAWEKLRSGLPCDLVFCDIEMPRMDGLELLSRIQKDPKLSQLPIAMLTSRGADRHRKMAAQLGAKGYFTKPYLEEQLLDAAARLLQGEVLVQEPTPTP
jgi:chemosensory pili system protein ChpA (sensor histidine kinase/response regulator)